MKQLLFFSLLVQFHWAVGQNTLQLDGNHLGAKINRNIYGHFAEHLGNGIYGGLYVGEKNNTIPNFHGIRTDVIEALKKLKVPVLRWPGGCFADTYHWKDGIGDKTKRPSILNVWWGNVKEDNSFGTHEFLELCNLLQAEPYLSGNVGSGTVQELSDWVAYINHPNGSSPITDLRAANGRKDPWKVKFWGIGNEAWGCGGNMKPEFYANVFRQYVTFLNNGNQPLVRIASGASDGDYHWTEVLMRDIPHQMLDAVALHHYSIINWNKKGSATNFSEEQYFSIMKSALYMEELVEKHSAIMDKYDPQKKVALFVDEWGGWYDVEPGTNPGFLFQQNTLRDAMIAGVTLNIFNNHCERVKMANLAQMVNVLQAVILTDKQKIIRTPTYHVMEMYNVHQDAMLIPLEIKSNSYNFQGQTLNAISASASKNQEGITHISLVNIDAHSDQIITINLANTSLKNITGRILTSNQIQDYNSFDIPDKVSPKAFTKFSVSNQELKVVLPPFSVVVLKIAQ
ncbi:MAG: alpha-L-arabinofuranosidase C-terminal domain-containing protein [Chitinophagia bacterium]|jgi:alpha-N-arabinofuranosidase